MVKQLNKVIALLLAMTLFLSAGMVLGTSQARFNHSVTWQSVYYPAEPKLTSNRLSEEGVQVLLKDWVLEPGADTREYKIKFYATTDNIYGMFSCSTNLDCVQASLSQPDLKQQKGLHEVMLTLHLTEEAYLLTETFPVSIHVSLQTVGDYSKQLWADFVVDLVPQSVLEETTAPTEVPEETTAPTEVPEETTAPTEVPEETTAPTEVPEETTAPTEVPEETTAPTEVPEETTAPTEVPEETTAPTEVTGETTAPTEVSEETTVPSEVPEETTAPTEVSEETTQPEEGLVALLSLRNTPDTEPMEPSDDENNASSESEETTPPSESEAAAVVSESEETTPPSESETAAAISESEETTLPSESETTAVISESEETTPTAESEAAAAISESEDTTPPSESEDTTPPSESEETTPPSESETTTPPAESETTTPPAEQDPVEPLQPLIQVEGTRFSWGEWMWVKITVPESASSVELLYNGTSFPAGTMYRRADGTNVIFGDPLTIQLSAEEAESWDILLNFKNIDDTEKTKQMSVTASASSSAARQIVNTQTVTFDVSRVDMENVFYVGSEAIIAGSGETWVACQWNDEELVWHIEHLTRTANGELAYVTSDDQFGLTLRLESWTEPLGNGKTEERKAAVIGNPDGKAAPGSYRLVLTRKTDVTTYTAELPFFVHYKALAPASEEIGGVLQ